MEAEMNSTIKYYNDHADWYYWTTVAVDMDVMRKKFASFLPSEARVIDMGCGSGRDVLCFSDMGFDAVGLDASEELVKLAKERLEIKAFVGDMATYRTQDPYDGIWCCASLFHLDDEQKKKFFSNLNHNLKMDGVVYISVKEGIETGVDKDGRFYSNCTEEELVRALYGAGCAVFDIYTTDDGMGRDGVRWLNVFARKIREL